ncbi:MAG: glutamate--tRNA ligase [Candidatus Krumholzibacteriia bacterium]
MDDTTSKNPRVRFAPSPTGRLHVGGARTALFNWLFARHHGGTMILRIEDTDAQRSTRESEKGLLEDLTWLGLDWDEGPDLGGAHAPYRQSERREIYAKRAARLVDAGHAYPCFCSDDLLAAKREEQIAAGEDPHYDGACRDIPSREASRRSRAGESHTVRFRIPGGIVLFQDRVRGPMQIDSATLGDFVLLRSSGLPTYNFACVVDDADMQITHVLRGEDHLYNTARQMMLFGAFGFRAPEFAHLSLILGEDRGRLKKRDGQEGFFVDEYRARGFMPDALVNFLALLGWSSPSGDEVLDRERLVREFDLDRVSKAPAAFDARKLRWMAGEHLRARPLEELVTLARPFLRGAGLPNDPARTSRWITAFKDGIAALDELPRRVRGVLEPGHPEPDAARILSSDAARRLFAELVVKLEAEPGEPDGQRFKELLLECGRDLGVRGRSLFLPARAALSGRCHGPELPLLFDAVGPARALQRLRDAAG